MLNTLTYLAVAPNPMCPIPNCYLNSIQLTTHKGSAPISLKFKRIGRKQEQQNTRKRL